MRRRFPQHLLVILALVISVSALAQTAVEDRGSAITVYWHTTREVSVRGASSVVVLDPEIARAEIADGVIRIQGVSLGETVALVSIDGSQSAVIVRVVLRPVVISPALAARDPERGFGSTANDAQISRIAGATDVILRHSFDWLHEAGGERVSATFNVAEYSAQRMHRFDLRGGTIDDAKPQYEVTLIDFGQDLSGNISSGPSLPYILSDNVALRGARVTFPRGRDSWTVFAGTTIPFYFLTLRDTRDVAGIAYSHRQSDALTVFGALSFVRAPDAPDGPRLNSVMQTAGLRYTPGRRTTFGVIGGISNRGNLARGYGSYAAEDWSAFGSFFRSSRTFPLNQLQSLFADTKALRAGVAFGTNRRVFENLSYEHTVTDSGLLSIGHAVSDYVSAAIGSRLTPHETATVVTTYSHTLGGFNPSAVTALRTSVALTSVLPHGATNTAQLQFGSVADPLGLQSQDELTFNDGFSVPVRAGSLFLGYAHNRVNPSLVQKLSHELDLLSPELQQLFLDNPAGFVASELPPEIRALLESQVPVSDSVTISLDRQFGPRLRAAPSVTFSRFVSEPQRGWTHFFGYSLSYQMTPSLLLRSSLSTVWATTGLQSGLQRSTIVTIGVQKSFTGLPLQAFDRSHTIEGIVFRDTNVNGVVDPGEPGIAGVEVQLDGGAAVQTDAAGRYRFAGLSGEIHRVSIDVAQFATLVRMTTLSTQNANLDGTKRATINFGVVDFGRLIGNVFNDLRFEGTRQPDSVPIGRVRVLLSQSGRVLRTIAVPASGTFEVTDVPPGEYDISVDADTIPADYSLRTARVQTELGPTATVNVDFALHAMRSISGHVFVRANDKLVPLAGAQVAVDHNIVKTDGNGAFVLRDLPAGNLTVNVVPMRALPADLKAPSGAVRLPSEPIHVEGATIVISNAALLPYLTDAALTEAGGGPSQQQRQR